MSAKTAHRAIRLQPFLRLLRIRTKDQLLIPLGDNLKSAQQKIIAQVEADYAARRPSRIIVLKARQLGCSTLSEALAFSWAFLHPNSYSYTISHNSKTSEFLFSACRAFYEYLPQSLKAAIPAKRATIRQLMFANGSGIEVATAENVHGGRGRTVHFLHCSEVALWTEPDDVMLALRQAVPSQPRTVVLIESTAFGVGNWFWYAYWGAVKGQGGEAPEEVPPNDYTPIFLPWYEEPEYSLDPAEVDLDPSNLDDDERQLLALGVGLPQLAWRRWAIANNCDGDLDRFHQEYPATAEEAFVSSGRPAFDFLSIAQCFVEAPPHRGRVQPDLRQAGRAEFVKDPEGPVRIFKAPGPGRSYVIGAVAVHPALEQPSVAHVLNRYTGEQVAVYEAHVDPLQFAKDMAALGAFYNYALLAPDVEASGYATIDWLAKHYPHLFHHRWADRWPEDAVSKRVIGWSTNVKRKEWAMSTLRHFLDNRRVMLHDLPTRNALVSCYIDSANPRLYDYVSQHGMLSELVMALAIACVVKATDEGDPPPSTPPADPSGVIWGKPAKDDDSLVWE